MDRIEKLEVPEEALREILYNAIIHKDYTGVHIQMRVWGDHVEVWNDGELPIGYTPETLADQHSSRPRNKNIANAFFKAGFIDAWGRGYKKIREGFEAAGLPIPTVENFCGGVRVMFQRKRATVNATVNATVKLNKTQEKIIAILRVDKFATYDVISKQLGVERTTVWRNIKKLQDIGRLRREGGDKDGYWKTIE